MNSRFDPTIEWERYELRERPHYHFRLNRRAFLQVSGTGLLVVLASRPATAIQGQSAPTDLAAWLHIDEDGKVTVYTGKVEVGQNIRTSLAQAVAEELHTQVESVEMVMGDTARTPYDQGTFGSRTTPFMAPQLRRAAAAAREILLDLGAKQWDVPKESLMAERGEIRSRADGRSVGFGALTRGRRLTYEIPSETPLSPPEQWRHLGRSVPKVGGRSFVDGSHQFTSDLRLPNMMVGKIIRPPVYGAEIVSVDAAPARAVPGTVVVHDGNFVGVAAPSEELARQAAGLVKVEWRSPESHPSQRDLIRLLKAGAAAGRRADSVGPDPVESALASARFKLDATYTVAYIAHAPMEPRAAVARWEEDALTVWTGTQRPFGVHDELVRAFRIPPDKVRVIMPDTGSGYGGKHSGDAAVEAARLARSAGRPVRLVWSREEEFAWAYFRPAGVIEVRSGMNGDGKVTAWDFHNFNSGGAAIRTPYAIADARTEFHPADSPLRQGSYRALAATANNFAREAHMNELALMAGQDPLDFRLRNLADPRMVAVLEAGAEAFGWKRRSPGPNRGFGLACGFEKGGYIANFVEVEVSAGGKGARILRVTAAFECGAVVNPKHLESQIVGCTVQGIGGALFEKIEFEQGRVTNGRFSRYRVPRFSDLPQLEVILVDRKDLPSAGGSETPIIAVAPAAADAVFQVTGKRLRALPLFPA